MAQTKKELVELNDDLLNNAAMLQGEVVSLTTEKVELTKQVRRLKLSGEEHCAVEAFLRKGVFALQDELVRMKKKYEV